MNDYELAITRCKELEKLLEDGFGAEGRGLHEKTSSVNSELPDPLIKKLRYIATLRNQLIHESGVAELDDQAGYIQSCDEAKRALVKLSPSPSPDCSGTGSVNGCIFWVIVIGLLVYWVMW